MSSLPAFRAADAIAPYREYNCSARLLVLSGGMQLPLAYSGRLDAENVARPTSRLLQGKQPTCVVVVEWNSVREKAKPEPVQVVVFGDFILHSAGAQVDGVYRDTTLADLIAASGFMVLFSTSRPENCQIPAFWTPYDGRYGTTPSVVPQYVYTPEEMGFKKFLPGITTETTTGNPTLQNPQDKGGLIK